jgi:hypothetical protein
VASSTPRRTSSELLLVAAEPVPRRDRACPRRRRSLIHPRRRRAGLRVDAHGRWRAVARGRGVQWPLCLGAISAVAADDRRLRSQATLTVFTHATGQRENSLSRRWRRSSGKGSIGAAAVCRTRVVASTRARRGAPAASSVSRPDPRVVLAMLGADVVGCTPRALSAGAHDHRDADDGRNGVCVPPARTRCATRPPGHAAEVARVRSRLGRRPTPTRCSGLVLIDQ